MRKVGLIINRIRPEMVEANDMMSVEDVQELLAVPLMGVIPDDERVIVSTNRGEPLVLSEEPSRAGQAYSNIARRLEERRWSFWISRFPPRAFFLACVRC